MYEGKHEIEWKVAPVAFKFDGQIDLTRHAESESIVERAALRPPDPRCTFDMFDEAKVSNR